MSTVLFIDNDVPSLILYQGICEGAGLNCITVAKPSQIQALLPTFPSIDLVLLDLQMPDLNGYQVLKILRSESAFQTVPIVACTVYGDEVDRAEDEGFSGFICKPIDVDRFRDQLLELLNGRSVWER